MFHLDGSNTCWLIYADYLDDQGEYVKANLIQQQIEHKPKRKWVFEYANNQPGGSLCTFPEDSPVGSMYYPGLGGKYVGNFYICVGGSS